MMEEEVDEAEKTIEDGDEYLDEASETFTGHGNPVYATAINPSNEAEMLTGGGNDRACIWQASCLMHDRFQEGPTEVSELASQNDTVSAVGFSPDGTMAATGSYDGSLMVWDVKTRRLIRILEGPEDVEWLDWHPRGNILIAGSRDCTVWMWLANTGDCIKVFAGHEGPVTCGMWTSDGKFILSGSDDGSVRVWGPKAGNCKHVFSGHGFHNGAVTSLASSFDGTLVLSGGVDGTARLMHVSNGKLLATLVHTQMQSEVAQLSGAQHAEEQMEETDSGGSETDISVETVGFSRVFNWCATGGVEGTLKIWDLTTKTCRITCAHNGSGITKLRWHERAPMVYTAATDGAIRLWDARNGQLLRELTGHEDMILDFALRCRSAEQGGDILLSGSDDGTAKVFLVPIDV